MHDTESTTTENLEREIFALGVQLAAAQAEIARMRATLDEVRACVRHGGPSNVIVALAALDTVPGDAMVPRITAAFEASGIDTGNVKGVE